VIYVIIQINNIFSQKELFINITNFKKFKGEVAEPNQKDPG